MTLAAAPATPIVTPPAAALSGGHISIGANSWFEGCEKWWISIPKRIRPPPPPPDPFWNQKMAEDEMCPLDSPGPPPLKNGGGEEIMASLAVPVPFRVRGLGGPVVHLI